MSSSHGSGSQSSVDPQLAADRAAASAQRVQYAQYLWFTVAGAIAALTLIHLASTLISLARKHRGRHNHRPEKTEEATDIPRPRNAVNLRRIPQAAVAAFRICAFRWTIPIGRSYVLSSSELFVSALYLGALFGWEFVNTRNMDRTWFVSRATHLAMSQLALLPALSGRNNIVSLLTGISYEKINFIHRSAARSSFILVLIHSFCKASPTPMSASSLQQQRYIWAVVSTTAMGAIFLLSLRPVRMHAFELFRVTHVLLVFFMFFGAYMHQPKIGQYVIAAAAIWGFERITRLIRLLFFNAGRRHEDNTATITPIAPNYVRITLRREMDWKPGQHVYLYLPGISNLPTEAHPFTIASIAHSLDKPGEQRRDKELTFIVRVMGGLTRKLCKAAEKEPGKQVTASVEGPYGIPPNLRGASTVVLIAGGSGVSFTLPHLLDLVRHARLGSANFDRLLFIWIVRDAGLLEAGSEAINSAIAAAPAGVTLSVRLFVTGAQGLVPTLEDKEKQAETPAEKDKEGDIPIGLSAKVEEADVGAGSGTTLNNAALTKAGRPDLEAILREEIETASGRVSVATAGPAALTKHIRAILRSDIAGPLGVLKGRPLVDLHVENFGITAAKK